MGSGGKDSRKEIIKIRDKSRRVEKLLKDSSYMGSGGQGRRKEKQKIRGRLGKKKDTQPFPGNGARKLVSYFSVTNKSASAQIPLYLSPQSIPRVIESTGDVCALTPILVGSRTHQDRWKG